MRTSTIKGLLERHEITQSRVAVELSMDPARVSDLVNDLRSPRTDTVNRVLRWARKYEPAITYDELFGHHGEGLTAPKKRRV